MFGPFRSTGVIGRGGMGEVHGAQHEPSGTPAAVKRILGTAAREARFRAAFRNEVRAVAGLSHPGVVRLYDFGLSDATSGSDDDEAPWLAMERLDGALHRETAVGIHHQGHLRAEGARHGGHDLLGAAGPLVDIASALSAHAELEGIESQTIAQLAQARGLVTRGDVALHRRGVGAQTPWCAA